ncbi:hypothetical protein QUA07_28860 [Microcoleus sp. T3_A4]|uniref:hypothetical protein n=1 Tax=Microcoleus sp. T3_A4 TaxID=2818968 RepID=UPI002FD33DB4
MIRCEKCNSLNVKRGETFFILEQLEEKTHCRCNDCGASFEKYSDITDPEVRHDLRNQLEIQQEERGERVR